VNEYHWPYLVSETLLGSVMSGI